MKPTLVIMAAGMGSRYGGLKQIDKIGPGGEIVIDYSIFDAIRAGFGKVVFIIRKDIEAAFREVVEPNIRGRIPFDYVFQELSALPSGFTVPADRKKPWGTTHAILQCRGKVNEPGYVKYTAMAVARARGITTTEVANATTENFFRLFTKVRRPADMEGTAAA